MNLTSPSQVRKLLGDLGIRASKALGQNFLVDKNILDILVHAADLSRKDRVLEVGPGLGTVTGRLLDGAGRVVAVEKDRRLHAFLETELGNEERLELLCGDVLDLDFNRAPLRGLNKVVSNLPYSSGSRILAEMARATRPPGSVIVTVQREVAARLAACPRSKDYGLLSVWMQLVYDVEPVKTGSPGCFWPKPEVASTIVRMTRRKTRLPGKAAREAIQNLAKTAFTHRRKQLATILSRAGRYPAIDLGAANDLLRDLDVPSRARPEDLSIEEWCRVAHALRGTGQRR